MRGRKPLILTQEEKTVSRSIPMANWLWKEIREMSNAAGQTRNQFLISHITKHMDIPIEYEIKNTYTRKKEGIFSEENKVYK